ncbi:MAG: glycosyl hydrolase family 28 protein, partial [Paraprevotella sp.]|nr:glycosyl hydrolase family 28 protein [Paraprevotella sp.]
MWTVEAKIAVYPRVTDKTVAENGLYRVYVREVGSRDSWNELQVFCVEVDMDTRSQAAMAQFDMGRPVEIRIVVSGMSVDNVKIRPLVCGINYKKIGEHALTFILEHPLKLSIEFGGDRLGNLHLFANPVETETYDGAEEKDVINWGEGTHDIFRKHCRLIYFGPGVHAPKDLPNNEIAIPSNCTVYLAPGAVVKAKLRLDKVENVRILGRGMLYHPLRGVEITHSRNIRVEGITVVDPQHYTIYGGGSENVTIRNVKSFSSRGWSYGIDLMCCRNWLIDDVFLRTSDDCLAFYNHRWWFWGNSRELTVQNSVLWADAAHAMHIGLHGDDLSDEGELLSKVTFCNIDVLNVDEDDDNYRGVMAVCSGGKNRVEKVLFENVRVEDCEEARLIDVRVCYNEKYNREPGGSIRNVIFRNITYQGEEGMMYPMRIRGYNHKACVAGVILDHILLNGRKMEDTQDIEMNDFVSGVEVK